VRWLTAHGADLNHTAKYHLSALMLAVINGRDAIVGILVDAGADRSIEGSEAPGFAGKTALDIARGGKATAVGAATAIVVGLVAITPAAGFVSPTSALLLGGIAAFPSYFAILYRAKTKLDDSLDVVAAHGVGGTVGALLTGVFAQKDWSGLPDGLLFGNPDQMRIQAIGVGAVIVYAALMTFVILKVMGAVMALRAEVGDEGLGMDVTQHGEEAYTSGEGAILVLPDLEAPSVALQARLANEGGKA